MLYSWDFDVTRSNSYLTAITVLRIVLLGVLGPESWCLRAFCNGVLDGLGPVSWCHGVLVAV